MELCKIMECNCIRLAIMFTLISHSRQWDVGSVYRYSYESELLVNEPQSTPAVPSTKDVGFKVKLMAEITPLWRHHTEAQQHLFRLQVKQPSLWVRSQQGPSSDGFTKKKSILDSSSSSTSLPLYIHWNDGVVTEVWRHDKDLLSSINIKKGVASLLQYQLKNFEGDETDTSGRCEVIYRADDRLHITKLKRNCRPINSTNFFNVTEKVLGAIVRSEIKTRIELNLSDSLLKSAQTIETHLTAVEARRKSGAQLVSKQFLNRKDSTGKDSSSGLSGSTIYDVIINLQKKMSTALLQESLATEEERKECIKCRSLAELVNEYRNSLAGSQLGTQGAALAFLRVLKKVRESPEEDIKKELFRKKNENILPQLLDITAAAQTLVAHRAVMGMLKIGSGGSPDLAERYLMGLSLSTHPPKAVVKDLLKLMKKGLKDPKLFDSLVLAVASMARTLSQQQPKSQVAQLVFDEVQTRINECSKDDCRLLYIRAIRNLSEAETSALLMKFVQEGSKKVATAAMSALLTLTEDILKKDETLEKLLRIFLQLDKKQDWGVRSMAAEAMLKARPTVSTVRSVISALSSSTSKEFKTLILARIEDLSAKNDELKKAVSDVLKDQRLGNYHLIAQNGASSAFTRPLVENDEGSTNSSFTSILEINGGLLKRSVVDVFVNANNERLNLFSFGIFAGGLSAFSDSGNNDAEDEDEDIEEDTNAGIEVSIRGTQLRPFVFFSNKGELMGHVWSGTCSERTTALQATMLLQDHQQRLPLGSGMTASLSLTGGVSFDFAGQVQVSLWNRNAHSLVEVGAAMVIQGSVGVDNSLVQSFIEFNTGAQTQLNFLSDLEFYEESMMCLQMSQPEFEVVEKTRKLERIPATNYSLRKVRKKSSLIPGRTYVMNKKNTALCNKMFKN